MQKACSKFCICVTWELHSTLSMPPFLFLYFPMLTIYLCIFFSPLLFFLVNNLDSECCSHKLVPSQVFYPLWGRLWLLLAGRWFWICSSATFDPGTPSKVQWQWHCTTLNFFYTITLIISPSYTINTNTTTYTTSTTAVRLSSHDYHSQAPYLLHPPPKS